MDDFDGVAFVTFADLCGFKELMRRKGKAYDALNRLYNKAYELAGGHPTISALALSDCVIAWTPATNNNLDTLLEYLKNLHSHMLEGGYLMQTTVAKGLFCYRQRINLHNIEKGMIYGDAYLTAYLGNKKAECGGISVLHHVDLDDPSRFAPAHARCIQHQGGASNRSPWEFFWSVRERDEIKRLKRARRDSYQDRFAHLLRAYRGENSATRNAAHESTRR